MRLCRHANNRKFALTGIEQQPFRVTRDSQLSHGSAAVRLWPVTGYQRGLSLHVVSHGSRGGGPGLRFFTAVMKVMFTVTIKGKKKKAPTCAVCESCVGSTHVCANQGEVTSAGSHSADETQTYDWWLWPSSSMEPSPPIVRHKKKFATVAVTIEVGAAAEDNGFLCFQFLFRTQYKKNKTYIKYSWQTDIQHKLAKNIYLPLWTLIWVPR